MNNFFQRLRYTIPAGRSRSIAWADQAGGYIDISTDQCGKGAGYVHGHYCRLKDILAGNAKGIKSRQQGTLSVIPGEISIQVDEHRVDGALLLGMGAFWVGFSSACALVLPKAGTAWKEKTVTIQGKPVYILYREAEKGRKKTKKGYREEIEPSPEAIALASGRPFTIKETHSHLTIPEGYGLYLIIGPGDAGQGASAGNDTASGYTEVYIAWAEDSATACAKAEELVRQDGRSVHQSKIEQFFTGFSFRSGVDEFDQALAWAAFSGWTLVTREYGLGIWAGLPWFRDNWGRDTFIALPGILLVTGQFDAAQEVLATFAERQNQDPASPNYGRIPNRWRNPEDVIFNTVDGTPWFIREVWEYVQYTGDRAFALSMKPYVDRALEADLARVATRYHALPDRDLTLRLEQAVRNYDPCISCATHCLQVRLTRV
uniref:Glycogen debranching enzyme C-terminal domain-containing protein n=1 Tax=Gracilinema caldarium TaxID=215591 RepID=A0A7C3E9S7_9SPIR